MFKTQNFDKVDAAENGSIKRKTNVLRPPVSSVADSLEISEEGDFDFSNRSNDGQSLNSAAGGIHH